jgi:hypothetical protein
MTRSSESARAQLSKAGNVRPSAAQALKAALNPPQEPERELSWLEIATELRRASEAFEAERAARLQAEAEAPPPGETAAQMLARALRGSATTQPAEAPSGSVAPIPLNGPGVLNAVVAGLGGNATIHGGQP